MDRSDRKHTLEEEFRQQQNSYNTANIVRNIQNGLDFHIIVKACCLALSRKQTSNNQFSTVQGTI